MLNGSARVTLGRQPIDTVCRALRRVGRRAILGNCVIRFGVYRSTWVIAAASVAPNVVNTAQPRPLTAPDCAIYDPGPVPVIPPLAVKLTATVRTVDYTAAYPRQHAGSIDRDDIGAALEPDGPHALAAAANNRVARTAAPAPAAMVAMAIQPVRKCEGATRSCSKRRAFEVCSGCSGRITAHKRELPQADSTHAVPVANRSSTRPNRNRCMCTLNRPLVTLVAPRAEIVVPRAAWEPPWEAVHWSESRG